MVMVHCICTCDTQIWHFVLETLLPTSQWRVSKIPVEDKLATPCLRDSVKPADLRLSLQIAAHIACHSGIKDVSLYHLKDLLCSVWDQMYSFLAWSCIFKLQKIKKTRSFFSSIPLKHTLDIIYTRVCCCSLLECHGHLRQRYIMLLRIKCNC